MNIRNIIYSKSSFFLLIRKRLFFLSLFLNFTIFIVAQKKTNANLLDAKYRVSNAKNYPIMKEDMKGFEEVRNNILFIETSTLSIYRGHFYLGYERYLKKRSTLALIVGIAIYPDFIAWGISNSDDFGKKDKTKLRHAIHIDNFYFDNQSGNVTPFSPGPIFGLEYSYALSDIPFQGFAIKGGWFNSNFRVSLRQEYHAPRNNGAAEILVAKTSTFNVHSHVFFGAISYKKMISNGIYFDGSLIAGYKVTQYGIKVKPFEAVYGNKYPQILTIDNPYKKGLVDAKNVWVEDSNGRKPYQFIPTFMIQARLGFGFKKSK
jgi:hypothetical protein